MKPIRDWFTRQFANPQTVSLVVLFAVLWLALTLVPTVSQPLLAAIVVAYLLEGPVAILERRGLGRTLSASLVWLVFYCGVLFALFTLMPQLLRQVTQVVQEVPRLLAELQDWLISLSGRYPNFLSDEQIETLLGGHGAINLAIVRDQVLARSRLLGVGATLLMVYMILVPLIAFFLLKDKRAILGWLRRFLPDDIHLIKQVWGDVDRQLANYVRGKVIEIIIVALVTYGTFTMLGLGDRKSVV